MPILTDLIALNILKVLVEPFTKSKAYTLGVIDANGNLRKSAKLFSQEERESYDMLHRIVFKLKKIIGRIPGGQSKIAALAAAYWLVKEERDESLLDELIENKIIFAEEFLVFAELLDEDGGGGAGGAGGGAIGGPAPAAGGTSVANVTGSKVSTDQPVVRKKDKKKYFEMNRRSAPKNIGEEQIDELSKEKMTGYIHQAHRDAILRGRDVSKEAVKSIKSNAPYDANKVKKHQFKIKKREEGMRRASLKMPDETFVLGRIKEDYAGYGTASYAGALALPSAKTLDAAGPKPAPVDKQEQKDKKKFKLVKTPKTGKMIVTRNDNNPDLSAMTGAST